MNFNTSHVTVYLADDAPQYPVAEFQYISCYCLSVHGQLTGIVFPYFNTSHVTVYRRPDVTYLLAVINFNTSHVTVYLNPDIDDRKINIFQYISCYCLSYTFEWLQCRTLDFNTSHVTVYLLVARLAEQEREDFNTSHVTVYPLMFGFTNSPFSFQYISCYCLSWQLLQSDNPRAFQYISCYCLSFATDEQEGDIKYFNTSHVTVYQIFCKSLA